MKFKVGDKVFINLDSIKNAKDYGFYKLKKIAGIVVERHTRIEEYPIEVRFGDLHWCFQEKELISINKQMELFEP